MARSKNMISIQQFVFSLLFFVCLFVLVFVCMCVLVVVCCVYVCVVGGGGGGGGAIKCPSCTYNRKKFITLLDLLAIMSIK